MFRAVVELLLPFRPGGAGVALKRIPAIPGLEGLDGAT